MSNTPDPTISDSWVDLGGHVFSTTSPISLSGAVTPTRRLTSAYPFGGEHDYLRMLREAQREISNRSSTKVSPISSAFISGKNTPSGSPKSPPNTPNPELASSLQDELKAVYINHIGRPEEVHNGLTASDIMWDWTSKPNIPCKEWTITSTRSRKSSSSSKMSCINNAKESIPSQSKPKEPSFFSREFFFTVLITNLVSLLVGAGIGIWMSKRGVHEDVIVEIGI